MTSASAPSWRASGAGAGAGSGSNSNHNPRKRPAPSDAQEDAWVAGEDQFVLQQSKKKAILRVRAKRAKPIDWLAVTLSVIDKNKESFDDEDDGEELEVMDPEGVLEGLDKEELKDLEKEIATYIKLERDASNREYWQTMKLLCRERQNKMKVPNAAGRGLGNVSSDIDRLLGTKSYEQLLVLEKQIKTKLSSDDSIDVEYWEHLLDSLQTYKAKSRLRRVSQAIVKHRLDILRKQQCEEANRVADLIRASASISASQASQPGVSLDNLDPEPLLKLSMEDKSRTIINEQQFLQDITKERERVQKLGYIPKLRAIRERSSHKVSAASELTGVLRSSDDSPEEANALFQREVARGVGEDEEIMTNDITDATDISKSKSEMRKPKYFNRIQLGYEWNKYNQTHYDHDNPPPKVVQGYRFNIFYPNLIGSSKAPTYRIEREGGRKRGQTAVPAGEVDTCVIRFIAGPPYQDIAFQIVDREWDYSAKRERGFRSTFENGVLMLHFQFKRVYYRK